MRFDKHAENCLKKKKIIINVYIGKIKQALFSYKILKQVLSKTWYPHNIKFRKGRFIENVKIQ